MTATHPLENIKQVRLGTLSIFYLICSSANPVDSA
jgi:hypothetical protein